jgi:hypothetical protein
MLPLFGAAIFTGAALVFLVQPMVAKMVLPLFGGSPNVWNTSMVFFQAALLVGYGYAHLSIRLLGVRRQMALHLAILALPLAALPIVLPAFAAPPVGAPPALWLLGVLLVASGAPYTAVTTASPVLQRWFAGTDHPAARDPYFLYAMGNAGSLLGLLGYPFLIEPNLSVVGQRFVWGAGYVAFVVLVCACALVLVRRRALGTFERAGVLGSAGESSAPTAVDNASITPDISWRRRLRWVLLAFVPSSLMLGVTNFLSTDIAAVPLLWVVPLSLYLLTFIIAFGRRSAQVPRIASIALAPLVVALALTMVQAISLPIWLLIPLHLATFFAAGLLAHGRLALDRPPPARLTEYFFLLSVGGVLGGIFNALVAPLVFSSVFEYPLVIVVALLLRPGPGLLAAGASEARGRFARYRWALDLLLPLALYLAVLVLLVIATVTLHGPAVAQAAKLILVLGALAAFVFVLKPVRFALCVGAVLAVALLVGGAALKTERTFFGVYRVIAEGDRRHLLIHGTTVHGAQNIGLRASDDPLTYYHRTGPVGQVFDAVAKVRPIDSWALVGLGSGSMVSYAQPGQSVTVYEIDPAVVSIAEDPRYFTYLRDSRVDIRMVLGDGRLTLQDAPDGSLDLLFMDAFSSDAPPTHLMTREALQLYASKLKPNGLMMFNASNRFLDLRAALEPTARSLGFSGLYQIDGRLDLAPAGDKETSIWVTLAPHPEALAPLIGDARWKAIDGASGPVWSDDFSDVFSLIQWGH